MVGMSKEIEQLRASSLWPFFSILRNNHPLEKADNDFQNLVNSVLTT